MSIYSQSSIGTDANQVVSLSKGKFAIIDAQDADYINQWKWTYLSSGYAFRRKYLGVVDGKEQSEYILMHRLLMDCPEGYEVDHINHNRLDNRKSNLRIVTRAQNTHNAGIRSDNTSGHKNIYWYKAYKKWMVTVGANGKSHFIGYYDKLDEAVEAKKLAIKRLHGEYANVNI